MFFFFACTEPVDSVPAETGDSTGPTDSPIDTTPIEGFALLSLDPAQGPDFGGTLVRVSGNAFSPATTVSVGGQACSNLQYASPTELFCETPAGSGEVELEVSEGVDAAALPFTYLAEARDTSVHDTDTSGQIEGCTLVDPVRIDTVEDEESFEISGTVDAGVRTELEGEPIGVEMQFGIGPAELDPAEWAWQDAYYDGDGDGVDSYYAWFWPDEEGVYGYSFRARVDHGDWLLCTTDAGAYGEAQVAPPVEIPIDYCHIQWPCSTSVVADEESELIYAWIYLAGVTDMEGEGEGLWIDVGVGPTGSDPASSDDWSWYSMDYGRDQDGYSEGDLANDEFEGSFWAPDETGDHLYTVRASADDGVSWTYCDLGGDSCGGDGSDDGWDESTAGQLSVE